MSEVEGKQVGSEVFMIEALDDRVVPVHFRAVAGEHCALIIGAVRPANRRQCKRVLAHPVVSLDDGVTRGDQIAEAHTLAPRISSRLRDAAPQGYRVLEAR